MNTQFSLPPNNERDRTWAHQYLGGKEFQSQRNLLTWWHHLTAPPEPPANASFAQREQARRGQLGSTLLFFLMLVLLLVLPIGIFGPNHVIGIVISILLIIISCSLILNKRGYSNIAGLIVAATLNAAIFTVILRLPGGLDASSLGLFDLLVFVELLVASLLPVNWIFAAAAINICFIIADLSLQPRVPAFAPVMAANFYPILVRPIILHIIVTVVLWLWVRSATNAIARADRAEVIATLEHTIAEQEHVVAEEKRLLDASVKEIVDTHIRVANGDFNARVPLREGNTLWTVAVSLNNLLTRLQRLRQAEQELQQVLPRLRQAAQREYEIQQLQREMKRLQHLLREAELSQRPVQLAQTGTLVDFLTAELNGKYLLRAPSQEQ